MKKVLMFICLLAIVFSLNAQENVKPEKHRYIYLWDVTLSLKGFQGKTPDIYDEVVEYLHESIDGRPNGKNREIIVCPFQEEILETWIDVCTNEGKNNLKKLISNFNNEDTTYTNIVDPLKYVVENFVDVDNCVTTIYLLTDGNQNAKDASEPLKSYLNSKWNKENRFTSYLKIIKLVPNILNDIESSDIVDVLEGHEIPMEIVPSNYVNYNIIEANKVGVQEIKIQFTPDPIDNKIPDGVDIRVYSDKNSIIKVDEVLPLIDGFITIPLNYDYESLKREYEGKKKLTLRYEIQEHSRRIVKSNKEIYVISISSPLTEIDVVNEPQKTLKITLK